MPRLFKIDDILFGADYYPEQWPREVWADDIALMKKARVNCVSLAIFSWASIEGSDGKFDFEWLDFIIEQLHLAGISVNLATATASPPAWLCSKQPDFYPWISTGWF